MNEAKAVIEQCGDRDFRLRLATALKRKMNNEEGIRRIRKVQMEASHSNNLLQLADMIRGSLARDYSGKDQAYRKLIESLETRVQF